MRRVLVLVLAAATASAGCLSWFAAPPPVESGDAPPPEPDPSPVLPDGRVSSAMKETNRTEGGLGGRPHDHDYWGNATALVLFEGFVGLSPIPVFPDGEGSSPKSEGVLTLPEGRIVPEGSESLTLVVNSSSWASALRGGLFVQARTASDAAWRDPVRLDAGSLTMPLNPADADMPHSRVSLWAFRFTTERPTWESLRMTVTVTKAANATDWPGHPDVYATARARVIFDGDVVTHRNGLTESALYGARSTWVHPEKLVAAGTTHLHVWANVTRATSTTGAEPTGAYLLYHNATQLDEGNAAPRRANDPDPPESPTAFNFTIAVDPGGHDGPYESQSRWGFTLAVAFGVLNVPTVGPFLGCYGCASYEVEYHLTIIAVGVDAATREHA